MLGRIEKIKKKVGGKSDLIILISDPNVSYVTNIYKTGGMICIPRKKEPFMITSVSRKQELGKKEIKIYSVSDFLKADIKAKTIFQAAKKMFKKKKISFKRIAIDCQATEKMTKYLGKNITNISSSMLKIRSVKTSEEIKRIKKASEIAVTGVKTAKKFLKPGITERQLARILDDSMREHGHWYAFETMVASGPNSAFVHHYPTDRKIKKDDFVVVDCGCLYKGYHSDITRTFCLNPGKRNKSLYKTVLETQKMILRKLKIGVKSSALFDLARKELARHKYDLLHGLGHGVGLEIHEEPSLSHKSKTILKENMIFTVEPGVYIKNYGGVRIEDMVLLKKNGIEILTKFPRRL